MKACSRCGNLAEHGPVADADCALRSAISDDVQRHAAELDRPPTKAQTADLLAHLTSRYNDASSARNAVLAVLDLGWRPTVGVTA